MVNDPSPPLRSHVRLRLEGVRASLTPTAQKLCDFVLQQPESVLQMTISDLATAAGVSDATVTRVCQTMGYSGFAAFRVMLARDLVNPEPRAIGELKATDAVQDIRDKLIAGSVSSLEDTRQMLDLPALQQAAEQIARARRLDVYGIGGSATVALDIRHKLLRLGVPVAAYDDIDIMSMSSAALSVHDVALGVSHTGRTEPVVAAVRRARAGGACAIALTHDPHSPLAREADVTLLYAARPTAFSNDSLSGRIAQLVVADMLYATIACAEFERSVQRIDEVNALADQRRLRPRW